MKPLDPRAIALSFLFLSGDTTAQKEARPAWTSARQCLAPLALEVRSGSGELTLEETFFDGPFQFAKTETTKDTIPQIWRGAPEIARGIEALWLLDDHLAERAFREAITTFPDSATPYLGLALASKNNPRRRACYLAEAKARSASATPEENDLIALLVGEPALAIPAWFELARERSDVPGFALLLLRELLLESLTGDPHPLAGPIARFVDETHPAWPSRHLVSTAEQGEILTRWSDTMSPRVLRLRAEEDDKTETFFTSLSAEQTRIRALPSVMPHDTLNLGETSQALITRLRDQGDEATALAIAKALVALPYDAKTLQFQYGIGARDRSPWAIGRRAWATILAETQQWSALLEIPRGFEPIDKAEWFAWQVLAAKETDGHFNPWLAALRREDKGYGIIDAVETYLESDAAPLEVAGISLPLRESTGLSDRPDPVESPLLPGWPTSRPAPQFSLPDWEGKIRSLADFDGQPVLVIFFLGGGCLHCVEQLTAFGPWADRFAQAGIEILSISTDPVSVLSETLSSDEVREGEYPIPIVSDEGLDTFRAWSAYDEFADRAIHGTFLVDGEGEIIWEETGNTPYMHPDYLLYEAIRLLGRE